MSGMNVRTHTLNSEIFLWSSSCILKFKGAIGSVYIVYSKHSAKDRMNCKFLEKK